VSDSTASARWRHRARKEKTPLDELRVTSDEPAESVRGTMAAFLEWCEVHQYSRTGLVSAARVLRRFADWCEERELSSPVQVTRPVLERYQRQLYYFRKPNGQPLSVAVQQTHLVHIRQYFRWLCRENLLLANPASELVLPRKGRTLPRYSMSVAEVEAVLKVPDVETLTGLRSRAMLEVLWATGVRRAELASLLVWDVHFDKGTVMVRQGKGRRDRVVPISARALSWVQRYLDDVRPRHVMSPDEGYLFLSETGERMDVDVLTKLVNRLVRAAGIKAEGACHLFRHACATAMLEGGADIRYVQELLGHAMLETTQVYTHVAISQLKAVYAATHPGAKSESASEMSSVPPAADAGELLTALENEASAELGAGGGELGENG
jgi:integrase/recombinase XerD